MAIQIKSAGVVSTGTVGADIIALAASAGPGNTVLGLAGNDTITLASTVVGFTAVSVDAAGGADSVTVTNAIGTNSAATIRGGAGGDTLNYQVSGFTNASLFAGDGSDTLTISGIIASSNISLGAGADVLVLSGDGGLDVTNSTIAGGSGADTITIGTAGNFGSSQILGGGGADSITISAAAANAVTTGLLINGDSSVDGGGADTITFNTTGASVTINAKGGKDSVNLLSLAGTGSKVLGNAGADSITISGGVAGSANLIGGGSGNDTITVSGLAGTNSVVGGGGADSILLTAANAGINSGIVYAGAGKDTVDLGTSFSGALVIGALTDSTLSTLDTFQDAEQIAGTGLAFTLSAVTTTTPTTGVAGGSNFSGSTIYASGVIASSDFETAGNVTARAAILDAEGGGANTVFLFEAEDVNYLFIQGGSAGTADDYVAQIGTGNRTVSGINNAFDKGSITLS